MNLRQLSYLNYFQSVIDTLVSKGWTIESIADEIGVTSDGIRKWRKSERFPRNYSNLLKHLEKLNKRKIPPKKKRFMNKRYLVNK